MSTTVTYKGSTLTTAENQTRTLKTSGKYLEDDITIVDVTSGGSVTQDANGYIVLPSTGGGGGGGGLEYEEVTWTPSEDEARPTISFSNSHTDLPILIMMADSTGTDTTTTNSNYSFTFENMYALTGQAVPSTSSASCRYAVASYVYRGSSNPAQSASGITSISSGSSSLYMSYWVSSSEFYPYTGSDNRYWRAGRTYKWIAVWKPTT